MSPSNATTTTSSESTNTAPATRETIEDFTALALLDDDDVRSDIKDLLDEAIEAHSNAVEKANQAYAVCGQLGSRVAELKAMLGIY